MDPIDLTIAQLLGKPSPKVEWLLRAAEQIRQDNEQEKRRERGNQN